MTHTPQRPPRRNRADDSTSNDHSPRKPRRAATATLRRLRPTRRAARRASCLLLVFSLLTTSAPAAPQVFAGVAAELNVAGSDVWFRFGRLWAFVQATRGVGRPEQEKQSARDARAARLEISPGDVKALVGERIFFAASAYDAGGTPVGGVRIKWRAEDVERNREVRISRTGEFAPKAAGRYRVTAEGAGHQARVSVEIVAEPGGDKAPAGGPRAGEKPLMEKKVSTRDDPPEESSSRSKPKPDARAGRQSRRDRESVSFVKASYASSAAGAAATTLIPIDGEWNDGNYKSVDDPLNRRGDPPDLPSGDNAGSGNFQINAPVLELPGRGINLKLRLSYNSNLWTKAGTQITYDIDQDWPAPGWSLGFGRMIKMGDSGGSMLVDSDGTRHGYDGNLSCWSTGCSFTGFTTDATFVDYSHVSNSSGVITSGSAQYPDGTVVAFGAPGRNAVYPTRITDPNGNYITITYLNNSGPQIQSVTDTLGRYVAFYYDANGLLTAVAAPLMGISGGYRTLLRLHYRQLSLSYSFTGLSPRVRNHSPWVIDALYYPATRTGHWFGDADSYSSFGMIAKAAEHRTMSHAAASLYEQGTVSPGMLTSERAYNYPLTASVTFTGPPTYSTMTENWSGNLYAPPVTTFVVRQSDSPRTVKVIQPDGTENIRYSYNYSSLAADHPDKWKDGLTYLEETTRGKMLKRTSISWEKGAYESTRMRRVETMDERWQASAEEFSYGPLYNQVTEVRTSVLGDAGIQRRTVTEYDNSPAYINRHIFSLVKSVTVYDSDEVTRLSRTEYQYDGPGTSLLATPGAIMHNDAYNPYDEQYWVPEYCRYECYDYGTNCRWECDPGYWTNDYVPSTDYRGNLTRVVSYADPVNMTGAVVETHAYDVTGNRVSTSGSCCEVSKSNFGPETYYAYPTSQSRGAADPASPVRVTSSSTYDFSTGLALTTTNANGRTNQMVYNPDTLRPHTSTLSTGGSTAYTYDDNNMSVTEVLKLSTGVAVATKNKRFDGRGQLIREQALVQGSSTYDIVDYQYDAMGRPVLQSRPYRFGQQVRWTETFYDALGRVTKIVAPDGSAAETFYEATRPPGASAELGHMRLLVDAWGRQRWERSDQSGRIVEVIEPDPTGTGSVYAADNLVTRYAYDGLGNLVEVVQGAQRRRFRYDALSRLTHQKMAEASATLNDAGQYVGSGSGQWSHVSAYDERSRLVAQTDPRGVRTVYAYNNDPLGRLQSVTYDTSGFGDTANPVAAAAAITFQYMTSGDLARPYRVTAQGVSTEEFGYDAEGRLTRKTLTHASRTGYPLTVEYIYDTANRLTDVRYPAQYGTAFATKLAHYDYDPASRINRLRVNGTDFGSQAFYNADGQTVSLSVGPVGTNQLQESYTYDDRTGMMTGQKVTRAGVSLMDFSYDYLGSATTSGRTGQLKKITNNLNAARNRLYNYDMLGRLSKASNGSNWAEHYTYDRYGNRLTVTSTPNVADAGPGARPFDEQLALRPPTEQLPAFLREGSGLAVSDASPPSPLSATPPDARARRAAAVPLARVAAAMHDAAPAQTPAPAQSPTPAPQDKQTVKSTTSSDAVSPNAPSPIICPDFDPECNTQGWAPTAVPGGPYTGQPGQLVQFDGSGSYDEDGFISSYLWNFGDGTTGTGMTPTHAYASAGTYSVSLRVRDNSGLFSTYNFTSATISQPVLDRAAFVSHTVPQTMNAGHKYTVTVAMKNTGTTTWTAAAGYRLGAQNPQDNVNWGTSRASLPASVAPGGSVVLTFTVTAPAAAGTYNFQWQMLREGVAWFGDPTQNVAVSVAQPPAGSCTASVPCDGRPSMSYDAGTNRVNTPGWLYDDAGNQTRAQRADGVWQRFTYDAAGRVVKVRSDAGATVLTYKYGADNKRLMTQDGGDASNARTYYAWDGESVIAEYTEWDGAPTTPKWVKNYVHFGGRLIATQQQSGSTETVLYHHPDQLGSRLVVNPLTGVVSEQTALPFGTALGSETSVATGRPFTTYDRSTTTGMDYAVNRHYDPAQGRFTQADPIGMKSVNPANPQTLNQYAYCANDPVNHADANGLFFGRLFKAVGGFVKGFVKNALAITSRVAKAVGVVVSFVGCIGAKLLHNRWVMIGVAIGSLIFPPLGYIYKTFSELTSILQIAGLVLEQKWEELLETVKGAIKRFVLEKIAEVVMGVLQMAFWKYYEISDCAKVILGIFYPNASVNFDSIRILSPRKWTAKFYSWIGREGALTWGGKMTFFQPFGQSTGSELDLLGHEVFHVLQARQPGGLYRFGVNYVGGMITAGLRGQNMFTHGNFMEVPAYAMGLGSADGTQPGRIGASLGGQTPCP